MDVQVQPHEVAKKPGSKRTMTSILVQVKDLLLRETRIIVKAYGKIDKPVRNRFIPLKKIVERPR